MNTSSRLVFSVATSIARRSIGQHAVFNQNCLNMQHISRNLACMIPRQSNPLVHIKTDSMFARMLMRSYKNVPPKNSRALKTRQAAAKRFIKTGKG